MTITVLDSGGTPTTVVTPGDVIAAPALYTFNRPADTTAYAAGDLLANSTTAGSVVPMSWTGATISGTGGSGVITGVTVRKSTSTNVLAVRIHFMSASPTMTNGDNGAIAGLTHAAYLGSADLSLSDGAVGGYIGQAFGLDIRYVLSGADTIYAVFEVLGAYTPTSGETFEARVKFARAS